MPNGVCGTLYGGRGVCCRFLPDAKCLSTRFVRTWREKKDDAGNAIWLRRSRLVAREYTWLQPDREALFSPASSNIATRILPICFLALREHQETLMLAIDVKDAFLTVAARATHTCQVH